MPRFEVLQNLLWPRNVASHQKHSESIVQFLVSEFHLSVISYTFRHTSAKNKSEIRIENIDRGINLLKVS